MNMNTLQFAFRWLHVLAGIIWIGHLYFLNFVNVPLQGLLDDAAKKAVNPQLLPRVFWWFRWGAMLTFLSGIVLYAMIYMYDPVMGFGMTGMKNPSPWIMMGMLFGAIMWFNVWFIIWPTNRKILSGQVPADQLPAARAKAKLFSRTNTYLSGPMLFGMLGANHVGTHGLKAIVAALIIGFGGMWVAIFHSDRVGKTV
jgi:uncharacterized membrane protein